MHKKQVSTLFSGGNLGTVWVRWTTQMLRLKVFFWVKKVQRLREFALIRMHFNEYSVI